MCAALGNSNFSPPALLAVERLYLGSNITFLLTFAV